MEYVDDCWCLEPGKCFRYVPDTRSASGDAPCRQPVTVRGSFRDGTGDRFMVDSCDGHAEGLDQVLLDYTVLPTLDVQALQFFLGDLRARRTQTH